MTDEEKEIFKNLKEYMQNEIDKGYNKFIYNDLGWDFKCIDCINAIDTAINLIEKQAKELEQKEKIIDEMAEHLTTPIHSKKDVVEYFENLAKESGEIDEN